MSSNRNSKVSTESSAFMNEFKQGSQGRAQKILFEEFPQRIERLDQLNKAVSEHRLDVGNVSTGEGLSKILQELKDEIRCMVEYLGSLKLWIDLNRPRLEHGAGFTLGVMDEICGMLSTGRVSGLTVMSATSRYYSKRAKIVSDVEKHPRITDCSNYLREFDEKTLMSLQQSCSDLRNSYVLVVDRIVKNLDKLQADDSDRHSSYMHMY